MSRYGLSQAELDRAAKLRRSKWAIFSGDGCLRVVTAGEGNKNAQPRANEADADEQQLTRIRAALKRAEGCRSTAWSETLSEKQIDDIMNALSKALEPSPAQPSVAAELRAKSQEYLNAVGERYVNVAYALTFLVPGKSSLLWLTTWPRNCNVTVALCDASQYEKLAIKASPARFSDLQPIAGPVGPESAVDRCTFAEYVMSTGLESISHQICRLATQVEQEMFHVLRREPPRDIDVAAPPFVMCRTIDTTPMAPDEDVSAGDGKGARYLKPPEDHREMAEKTIPVLIAAAMNPSSPSPIVVVHGALNAEVLKRVVTADRHLKTYSFTHASYEALGLDPAAFKTYERSFTDVLIVMDERGVQGPRGSPIIVIFIFSSCSDVGTQGADAQKQVSYNLLSVASALSGAARTIAMEGGGEYERTVFVRKLTQAQNGAIDIERSRLRAMQHDENFGETRSTGGHWNRGNQHVKDKTIANGKRAPNGQGARYGTREQTNARARERKALKRKALKRDAEAADAGPSASASPRVVTPTAAGSNALVEENTPKTKVKF